MFSSYKPSGLFDHVSSFSLFPQRLPPPPKATRQENPQPKRASVAPAPVALPDLPDLPEAPKERKPRKVRIAPERTPVREAKPPEPKAPEPSEAPKLKVIADILHKPRKPSEMSGLWKKAREANIPGFNKMKKSELRSVLGIEDEA